MEFYAAIGKRPIHIRREVAGHVANRLQAALWREAVHLVASGVASVADVDAAISEGPGLRWALMGPHPDVSSRRRRRVGWRISSAQLGPPLEELVERSRLPEPDAGSPAGIDRRGRRRGGRTATSPLWRRSATAF